ncbi:MAG TPA: flagellar biosynthesis protein FlhF [Bryobacteraceae bacterium]|nr:flagellar biosynthesis protein FlhF [Bryobacteraceae bacterium]
MRIKSYFARTVEDAMGMARQELGQEAMLVNSRRAPVETRHLGEYEVVFAVEFPTGIAGRPDSGAPAAPPISDRLSAEVADLKKELETMRRTITRSALVSSEWLGTAPGLSDAYALLTANDVTAELAREIVHAAEARAGGPRLAIGGTARHFDAPAFQRALVEELESRFTVEPTLGRGEARPRVVALVGPPGSGKTTTLVKLAVNYGLASRRPVTILSTDTYRVAAADQLRAFASILGVNFQVIETVSALAQAIEEHRNKDLIFIDTPGLGFSDLPAFSDLAKFLSTRPDIDTQLVLTSSMKSADLTRVMDSFEVFRPQRLLFTMLDATSSFGPIFNEAVRTGKPLSFFTTGQRIPEDLEVASHSRLTELLLAGKLVTAASAA